MPTSVLTLCHAAVRIECPGPGVIGQIELENLRRRARRSGASRGRPPRPGGPGCVPSCRPNPPGTGCRLVDPPPHRPGPALRLPPACLHPRRCRPRPGGGQPRPALAGLNRLPVARGRAPHRPPPRSRRYGSVRASDPRCCARGCCPTGPGTPGRSPQMPRTIRSIWNARLPTPRTGRR